MFTELEPLLTDRTLVLTISGMNNHVIRVNVIPKCALENNVTAKALSTPLSITGTAAELDRGLSAQLTEYTQAVLQASSSFQQVQEAHKTALRDIEAENRKALNNKRKVSEVKAEQTTTPVYKDGKPVFGSKPQASPTPASLFDNSPVSGQTNQDQSSASKNGKFEDTAAVEDSVAGTQSH